jgi:hypothetical protein
MREIANIFTLRASTALDRKPSRAAICVRYSALALPSMKLPTIENWAYRREAEKRTYCDGIAYRR